ncbi:MAG: CYTH domain-containing protein [Planctomycetes bacterium]|nr:CYTH domain-containing protein [Planctomycetota bacterium]
MSRPIEREFKLRIPDAEAEQRLLTSLGGAPARSARQTNHFFDTAQRALRDALLALRLREEQGVYTLALKGPLLGAPGALAARPEEELTLSADEARALLDGRRSPLALLEASLLAAAPLVHELRARAGTAPLLHLGAFENERLRVGPLAFPREGGGSELVFEFDTTHFPGGVIERELELELPRDAPVAAIEGALRALFAACGVPLEPARSKAERFFALLERAGPVRD